MQKELKRKIIIGISGATGAIYGIHLLKLLKTRPEIETHLVVTKAAKLTIQYETNYTLEDVITLSDYYYNNADIGARIASGSFLNEGMIIAPASVKTSSEIASGITGTLISRAADVALKERRKLVIMFRETPLHLGHIKTIHNLTKMGAIIAPPLNAFYIKPQTIEDLINHSISRILDLFAIDNSLQNRWQGII